MSAPLLALQRQWLFTRGPAYGIDQPALLATLLLHLPQPPDWDALQQRLPELLADCPPCALPAGESTERQAAHLLLHWMHQLQRQAGLPALSSPVLLDSQPQASGATAVRIAMATSSGPAGLCLIHWALAGLQQLLDGADAVALARITADCRRQLQQFSAGGSNSLRFLQAARQLDMPWQPLAGNACQIGQGRRARWLDSSFTDRTPVIGSQLARNKLHTSRVLAAAGLPVPPSLAVASAEQACIEAGRLGYPVVIKPVDCERGHGVSPGLQNAAQVCAAWKRARACSERILLEKHCPGRDYRLTVLEGRLLWAIERIPGGVTGDGRHSVAQLLQQLNADPQRSNAPQAALRPVELDEEAHEQLARAGLGVQDIPAAGQFVRLRRTANVASGGTPVAVLEQVHPDNRRLAERAARALRLDLAGIDLLIPDIARSWLESGAGICEVNAQPQLGATTGPHLYGAILQQLVAGNGRIPLSLLLEVQPGSASACRTALRRHWQNQGRCCGWRDSQGVWLDDERLAPASASFFQAGQMLLAHPDCDALILSATPREILQHGLPFDRCDQLLLDGDPRQLPPALLREALRLLLPHAASILHASPHPWPAGSPCGPHELASRLLQAWQSAP